MSLLDFARQAFFVSVFVTMISVGLASRPGQSVYLLRRGGEAARSFVAMYVAVPAVMIGLALILPAPPAAEVAVIALSAAPMLPTLPNGLVKLGADRGYCMSLEVLGALLALLVTPAIFWIVSQIAQIPIDVGIQGLMAALGKKLFLPLAIGIFIALGFPEQSPKWSGLLAQVGSKAILVCAVLILVAAHDQVLEQLTWQTLLALGVLIGAGLAAGHLLGGPEQGNRAALALSAASRNPGFSMAVATAVAPADASVAAGVIIIYYFARLLLVKPYTKAMAAKVAPSSVLRPT